MAEANIRLKSEGLLLTEDSKTCVALQLSIMTIDRLARPGHMLSTDG